MGGPGSHALHELRPAPRESPPPAAAAPSHGSRVNEFPTSDDDVLRFRRGAELEKLRNSKLDHIRCSKEFLVQVFEELLDLRGLLMPAERPQTVADYLAPILVHLDQHSDVEDVSENDEMQTLCWLKDAIDHDRAQALRLSTELVQSGTARSVAAVREIDRRCDALLDQLGLTLPEKVETYIRSLPWSEEATEADRTLVAGNLRAFAAAIRSSAPLPTETEAVPRA